MKARAARRKRCPASVRSQISVSLSSSKTCVPGGTFALGGRAAVLGTLNVHVNASGLVEVDTTAERIAFVEVTGDAPEAWLARWRRDEIPQTAENLAHAYRAALLVAP